MSPLCGHVMHAVTESEHVHPEAMTARAQSVPFLTSVVASVRDKAVHGPQAHLAPRELSQVTCRDAASGRARGAEPRIPLTNYVMSRSKTRLDTN